MDGYGENNPIVVKSQFIMSLVERIDPKGVGAKQKSIIDRCTGDLYEEAEQNGTVPTLAALREKLMEQPEAEAREIALALELFTTGSLDMKRSTVTTTMCKKNSTLAKRSMSNNENRQQTKEKFLPFR